MKKFVLLILILFAMSIAAGCHTMQGLGKDIQEAGEALEDAAD
ncbi:entericidin A/B family lipoprotein [bacterium]|nr:MAG: entericidin A/B family lipoprotein [bacterium]